MPTADADRSAACPLDRPAQTRNLLIYAACTALIYLCAPSLYVGVMHGSLCESLGASKVVANLPASVFFAMTFMPVIIAWWAPRVSQLKRNMIWCFSVVGLSLALAAVALALPLPNQLKVAVVILQGACIGIANPAAVGFLWEMIGRGVDESRRGLTLSLAFGVGPLFAVAGSALQAALLGADFFGVQLAGVPHPWGFVALFGSAAPAMGLAAFLCSRCAVPLPEHEIERQPFVEGVFGGLGAFLSDRLLRTAVLVTILFYAGNMISTNMNLYAPQVMHGTSAQIGGIQNMLRFAVKFAAGILLGWLLAKTHPKAGVLTTGALYILALFIAMSVVGNWYLIALGLYGAGELVGVYAPNYILSASNRHDMRRNMAFVQMIMVPTAPLGALYGWIAGNYGFLLSFWVCAALMSAGLLLAMFALPARPQPRADAE